MLGIVESRSYRRAVYAQAVDNAEGVVCGQLELYLRGGVESAANFAEPYSIGKAEMFRLRQQEKCAVGRTAT